MRLLLDENISWSLAAPLRPHCTTVLHVRDIGLDHSPDTTIWRYARQNNFDLLTKDEDFVRLVLAYGSAPCNRAAKRTGPRSQIGNFLIGAFTAATAVSERTNGVRFTVASLIVEDPARMYWALRLPL